MRNVFRCLLGFACLPLLLCSARADEVAVATLSFDTFIPSANGAPGIDAFDFANLTNSFGLPPDFPVADSLTFQSALLTLTLADSSQETLTLGDIGPGFLLDGGGNPLVQVSDALTFASAEFTAMLSPTTFVLADGSTFTAASASVDVLLLPSSGTALVPDVDQATINISGSAPSSSTPEPASMLLLVGGLAPLVRIKK